MMSSDTPPPPPPPEAQPPEAQPPPTSRSEAAPPADRAGPAVDTSPASGPIAWMVHHRVTPNLLMLTLIVGGLFMSYRIKKEVFPDFEANSITVTVPYPGASPEEVEQGIVLAVEEAVRGLEGVDEVSSTTYEGRARVGIELLDGANRQKAYQDVQSSVGRITSFPDEAEEPQVELNFRRNDVVDIELFGDVSEGALREAGEMVRDTLLQQEGITQVDLDGIRPPEVQIDVSEEALRRYNLTLADIARKVQQSAAEVPGGKVETAGGELFIRFDERRDDARDFGSLVVLATPDGSQVRLDEIATVTDGFEDTDRETRINSVPAIGVDIYRIGDETPIGVSDAVKAALPTIRDNLPPGVELVLRIDDSDVYRQRLALLFKNAFFGLVLVLALLGLFLEFKLAFWVTMGIPISFLGTLLFLPFFDVSINMITMFAFIIALGIVVDDAIVAGENIYEYRQKGMGNIEAAIRGARDVTVPITFAILTNVIAFSPLLFVPGTFGKLWGVIPIVVCTTFIISLVEALFILPAHLAHTKSSSGTRVGRALHAKQQAFSRWFEHAVHDYYGPTLRASLRYRALTLVGAAALLILALAYVQSGRIGFILMPRTEADQAFVRVSMPPGSPVSRSRAIGERLLAAAERVIDENGGERLSGGSFVSVADHEAEVTIYLTEPGVRPISTPRFNELWRDAAGEFPDADTISFESDRGGPGSGAALTVELSHRDIPTLERAAQELGRRLGEFAVTRDVDDGFSSGKPQLNFTVTPLGESLGLTARSIAGQVRAAFQGIEAIKQQRGRNELTVRIRRPFDERTRQYNLEQMIVQTPDGGQVPLRDVAVAEPGRAYTSIARRDGRRVMRVSAGVEPLGETSRVIDALDNEVLPLLARDFPGLTYGYEGRQASMADSFASLKQGLLLALIVIYAALAIPLRSYIQPLIVMMTIPFGFIGAVGGHLIMGYDLSMISVMGIVALAGVVVNDSLVLIEYCNRLRRGENGSDGMTPTDAIQAAAIRRFRPILLTTLTTFGGLAPMIFETSQQAQFMIPMAVSLGFGILFATAIVLLILPCLYLVLNDARALLAFATDPEAELKHPNAPAAG